MSEEMIRVELSDEFFERAENLLKGSEVYERLGVDGKAKHGEEVKEFIDEFLRLCGEAESPVRIGEIYQHFKGGRYEILYSCWIAKGHLAEDSWAPLDWFDEPTWVSNDIGMGDKCMIYIGEGKNYRCVRSIESFTGKVTRFRFTKVAEQG